MRWRRANSARPYICLLIIFVLVLAPSVRPLSEGQGECRCHGLDAQVQSAGEGTDVGQAAQLHGPIDAYLMIYAVSGAGGSDGVVPAAVPVESLKFPEGAGRVAPGLGMGPLRPFGPPGRGR
jgi:hypothetical protein